MREVVVLARPSFVDSWPILIALLLQSKSRRRLLFVNWRSRARRRTRNGRMRAGKAQEQRRMSRAGSKIMVTRSVVNSELLNSTREPASREANPGSARLTTSGVLRRLRSLTPPSVTPAAKTQKPLLLHGPAPHKFASLEAAFLPARLQRKTTLQLTSSPSRLVLPRLLQASPLVLSPYSVHLYPRDFSLQGLHLSNLLVRACFLPHTTPRWRTPLQQSRANLHPTSLYPVGPFHSPSNSDGPTSRSTKERAVC